MTTEDTVAPTSLGVTDTLAGAPEESKKRVGRPKKKDIVANTPGKRAVRGRPPGEAAAMAEFKARILTSPKSIKVIEKIFDAALDDDHKNQSAAWKLLVDRMMPVSMFEDANKQGKGAITINISGIGEQVNIAASEDPLEGDYSVDGD